jgi:hypothetical protein
VEKHLLFLAFSSLYFGVLVFVIVSLFLGGSVALDSCVDAIRAVNELSR